MKWESKIKFTQAEVKTALCKHVMANASQFGIKETDTITNVDVRLGTKRDDGYDYGASPTYVLENITVTVERGE